MSAALPTEPLHIRRDSAPTYSLSSSDCYRFVFSGHPGQPEMIDTTAGRGDAAPLHRHPWATWELVVEGQVKFIVDDRDIVAEAGDLVYTPPNCVHSFIVLSETARMIGVNHPSARFESLQAAAMPLFQQPGGPDMPTLMKLAAEHDVEVLGPPPTL